MSETLREACTFIEQGHVRVGPDTGAQAARWWPVPCACAWLQDATSAGIAWMALFGVAAALGASLAALPCCAVPPGYLPAQHCHDVQ